MPTLFTDLQSFSDWRNAIPKNKTIGFVPTMGALHQGHISLMQQAQSECDHVVVSIYVNALQFNSSQDFARYPRTASEDFSLCAQVGIAAVLMPQQEDVFPNKPVEMVSPSQEAEGFEGADRPGHFAGVVTVVDRLFSIVQPSRAYFGIKDYQQVVVIGQMSSHLHPNVEISTCKTKREDDDVAMSSRNRLLTQTARQSAACFPKALRAAITLWRNGTTESRALIDSAYAVLALDPTIEVQYISIVKSGTMDQVNMVNEHDVIIAAVVIDGIRLIDNMQFSTV
jgi:pantoate--beta-alanine ligase